MHFSSLFLRDPRNLCSTRSKIFSDFHSFFDWFRFASSRREPRKHWKHTLQLALVLLDSLREIYFCIRFHCHRKYFIKQRKPSGQKSIKFISVISTLNSNDLLSLVQMWIFLLFVSILTFEDFCFNFLFVLPFEFMKNQHNIRLKGKRNNGSQITL